LVTLLNGITLAFATETDEIVFDEQNYVVETGLRGFGIPSPLLRIDPSAGDGGIFRQTKRDIRSVDIPIVVLGSSREDVESKLRRLSRLMLRKFEIRAYYADGSILLLEAYLAAGGDTQFGRDANNYMCRWVVTVKCPQPYWISREASSFSVGQGTERGLIYGNGSFMNLPIADERIFGQMTVNNPGDVPCPIDWVLRGPFDTMTLSDAFGNSFTYNAAVNDGDEVYISGLNSTVTDVSYGTNLYQWLSGNPKFFYLREKQNIITIVGTGLSGGSSVTAIFYPRYEVIH
jgi:hypothetical protein